MEKCPTIDQLISERKQEGIMLLPDKLNASMQRIQEVTTKQQEKRVKLEESEKIQVKGDIIRPKEATKEARLNPIAPVGTDAGQGNAYITFL